MERKSELWIYELSQMALIVEVWAVAWDLGNEQVEEEEGKHRLDFGWCLQHLARLVSCANTETPLSSVLGGAEHIGELFPNLVHLPLYLSSWELVKVCDCLWELQFSNKLPPAGWLKTANMYSLAV